MMSLVEYGSSDSEEEEEAAEVAPAAQAQPASVATAPPSAAASPPLPQPNENPATISPTSVPSPSPSVSTARTNTVLPAPSLPSLDELPDAEFLFSSPQNGSRKRESNGHGAVAAQQKFPRGGTQSSVAQVRNSRVPVAGTLVPPQLAGRSNVVTEDINKLFVNRRRNSSG